MTGLKVMFFISKRTYLRDAQAFDSSCKHLLVSDVGQHQAVTKLPDEIFSRTQTYPTMIVNAAGITRDSLLLKTCAEDFDDVIRVNLERTYHIDKIFCKRLLAQKPTDLKASIKYIKYLWQIWQHWAMQLFTIKSWD